jgi:hypothetical protein
MAIDEGYLLNIILLRPRTGSVTRRGSSMAEQGTHKPQVVSSNLTLVTGKIMTNNSAIHAKLLVILVIAAKGLARDL